MWSSADIVLNVKKKAVIRLYLFATMMSGVTMADASDHVVLIEQKFVRNKITVWANNRNPVELCVPQNLGAWVLKIKTASEWATIPALNDSAKKTNLCLKPNSRGLLFELNIETTQKDPEALLIDMTIGNQFVLKQVSGAIEYNFELAKADHNFRVLAQSGPNYIQAYTGLALMNALKSKKSVSWLFGKEHEIFVDELLQLATNKKLDETVRESAVNALASLGTRKAALAIYALVSKGGSYNLRVAAMRAAASLKTENLQQEILALAGQAKNFEFPDTHRSNVVRAISLARPRDESLVVLKSLDGKAEWTSRRLETLKARLQLGDESVVDALSEALKALAPKAFNDFLSYDLSKAGNGVLLAKALLPFFYDKRKGPYLGLGHGDDPPELSRHTTVGFQVAWVASLLLENADQPAAIKPSGLAGLTDADRQVVEVAVKSAKYSDQWALGD
jgi:hypothetical protein